MHLKLNIAQKIPLIFPLKYVIFSCLLSSVTPSTVAYGLETRYPPSYLHFCYSSI